MCEELTEPGSDAENSHVDVCESGMQILLASKQELVLRPLMSLTEPCEP